MEGSTSIQELRTFGLPSVVLLGCIRVPYWPRYAEQEKAKTVTAADFRRIALGMPGAVEGAHHGHPDFRVGGRIFATLAFEQEGYGVLVLTPDQQAGMVSDEPEIFSPVPGGWGRHGATRVRLAKVTPAVLEGALRTAWRRRAPKRLLGARRTG